MERKKSGKGFKLKGHTLPGINQNIEGKNLPDGRHPSSAFQQNTTSPMKSFLGLGADNREARRANRADRKQYREDLRDYRKAKREENRLYRQEMKDYNKELKELAGTRREIGRGAADYFRKNREDYRDDPLFNPAERAGFEGQGKAILGNPDMKKGRERRNIVREDFIRDYELENRPVRRRTDITEPTRPERRKLDYNYQFPIGRYRTAYNPGNPDFE
tara:strand:- start:1132 stop:1785 length:654 start_codon:yes stop_codon:yes gene_type:complete